MTTWETSLAFVWRPENDGADNNSAPGEAFLTRWGVTRATWEHARDEGIVDDKELEDAAKDELATVLRALFWNVAGCDRLAARGLPGPALMVFNMAMVSGVGRGARLLQRVVGVAEDGQVGPLTLAAAQNLHPGDLIAKLEAMDETFFASCKQAGRFLRGWTRRLRDARIAALALQATA